MLLAPACTHFDICGALASQPVNKRRCNEERRCWCKCNAVRRASCSTAQHSSIMTPAASNQHLTRKVAAELCVTMLSATLGNARQPLSCLNLARSSSVTAWPSSGDLVCAGQPETTNSTFLPDSTQCCMATCVQAAVLAMKKHCTTGKSWHLAAHSTLFALKLS